MFFPFGSFFHWQAVAAGLKGHSELHHKLSPSCLRSLSLETVASKPSSRALRLNKVTERKDKMPGYQFDQ